MNVSSEKNMNDNLLVESCVCAFSKHECTNHHLLNCNNENSRTSGKNVYVINKSPKENTHAKLHDGITKPLFKNISGKPVSKNTEAELNICVSVNNHKLLSDETDCENDVQTNAICDENNSVISLAKEELCGSTKEYGNSIIEGSVGRLNKDISISQENESSMTGESDSSDEETVPNKQESYEMKVKRRRNENRELLKSLGIYNANPSMVMQSASGKKQSVSKALQHVTTKHQSITTSLIPTRRSGRLMGKVPGKYGPIINFVPKVHVEKFENSFGPIPGVAVGTEFDTRMEASRAGVHRPPVAGIHGNAAVGCYSIALSGGYEDDVDSGYSFIYTGEGGRDLKGTKANPKNLRTAPQSKDQVLERGNLALAKNFEENLPVRVIRGYKLNSKFAPEAGYRYDGLYKVDNYFLANGASGFKVYKFVFSRLPDQDPAPWLDEEIESLQTHEQSNAKKL